MFSQPITFDQAQQVAEKFCPSQCASKYAKELQRRVFEDAGQPTMYAFSIADRWVLIAGDRRMPPILAYSDEMRLKKSIASRANSGLFSTGK